ncbi:MAG: hypothetical protein Q4E87_03000 [bacterium]|nr:hypothetical protein [bacterium]
MTKYTEKLNLFEYEPDKDGKKTFKITQALNDNWDKIENFYKKFIAAVKSVTVTGTKLSVTDNQNNKTDFYVGNVKYREYGDTILIDPQISDNLSYVED